MYIDPNNFNFMTHWSDDDKKMAAKITHNLVRRYVNLFAEDAVSEAFVAILKAKSKYGNEVTPKSISGYIRAYLYRFSSKMLPNKNKSFSSQDEELTARSISSLPLDDFYDCENERDVFCDVQKILDDKEYQLLLDIVVLEKAFKDKTQRRLYRKILEKIRDTYYA